MLCLLGMLVQPLNPVEYYICNGITFSKFHGHGKGLACSKLFVGLASYDLLNLLQLCFISRCIIARQCAKKWAGANDVTTTKQKRGKLVFYYDHNQNLMYD